MTTDQSVGDIAGIVGVREGVLGGLTTPAQYWQGDVPLMRPPGHWDVLYRTCYEYCLLVERERATLPEPASQCETLPSCANSAT